MLQRAFDYIKTPAPIRYPVVCIWCNDTICHLPSSEWPPVYHGKRVFLDQRRWDQSLFHTIFDHYSRDIVAVHYSCKTAYYRKTFPRGRLIPSELVDYRCPTCNKPFKLKEFKVNGQLQVIHRGCLTHACDACHRVIGHSPAVRSGQYIMHSMCAANFCDSPLISKAKSGATNLSEVGADIDTFWPDQLTKITACLYPPEFRATMRGFLLALKRFNLPYRFPTDLVLLILNMAVGPMSYPVQHGLEIAKLNTVRGGECNKCYLSRALTRFDKDYCTRGKCLIFSDQKCRNGHKTKFIPTGPADCTAYRCFLQAVCRQCKGPIRYSEDSPVDWCRLNDCNHQHSGSKCHCGRPLFKDCDYSRKPRDLRADQCTIKKCPYVLEDRVCACGDLRYSSSINPYNCTADKCGSDTRQMVNDAMQFIDQCRAKGNPFAQS